MSNEVVVLDQRNLAVELTSSAVSALSNQRIQLKEFIKNQLVKDVDYGRIPGTAKDTLYKPGAEKIANIFQLGSRIVDVQKEVSFEPPAFAMFTYRVEMFHLPSGKIISQCEGSCNSEEKKYKKVQIGDLLNTLQKMAQKRAYVGAVIIATGASDFFTQDLEDLPPEMLSNETGELTDRYIVQYGRDKGKPLFECDKESLRGYVNWAKDKTAPKMKADAEIVASYLRNPESFENVG